VTDKDANAAVDGLVKSVGSDAAVVDLLCTTAEREMAATQAEHAPVFELELDLSRKESPVIGSGHGLDFALVFQPANPGIDGPIFSAEQKAAACQAFFGRDELGGDVQRLADGLRSAIARFALNGNPEHLLDIPWPKAHGDQPGQMIGSATPHYEAWGDDGISSERKLVREAMRALPLQKQ
jgi:carboxylesterase type B